MAFEASKEWWLAKAKLEPDVPIAAGVPDDAYEQELEASCNEQFWECEAVEALSDASDDAESVECDATEVLQLRDLVHLLRRKHGLSIEQLAEQADIDVADAKALEEDLGYEPEFRTIYQLSNVFGLPFPVLSECAGFVAANDFEPIEGLERFAARSASRNELDEGELALLVAITATVQERASRECV